MVNTPIRMGKFLWRPPLSHCHIGFEFIISKDPLFCHWRSAHGVLVVDLWVGLWVVLVEGVMVGVEVGLMVSW